MINILGYPFLKLSEILGGLIKVGMGYIVFTNIKSFSPNQSEYIIIVMLCMYFIISGLQTISPYVDETADRMLQFFDLKIRTYIRKKK